MTASNTYIIVLLVVVPGQRENYNFNDERVNYEIIWSPWIIALVSIGR